MRMFRNRTFVFAKNLIIRKRNIANLYDLEHSLKKIPFTPRGRTVSFFPKGEEIRVLHQPL